MTQKLHHALLPAGMLDLLPPEAESEAKATELLMEWFSRNGYERVKPPLVEFEDNLMVGSGAATAGHSFRLMDPISQRMMALRADMTIQIARIALSRLSDQPRPIRLSYAGEVLRVRGSDIRPQRQFNQVGIELIGSDSHLADVEIIELAGRGLTTLGISDLSVDLGMPTLVSEIFEILEITDENAQRSLRAALNQKDRAKISSIGGEAAKSLDTLISAVGPADTAIKQIKTLNFSPKIKSEVKHLESVVSSLRERIPWIEVTVDPVEIRGYEYHTGLTFTLFSKGIIGELGRGGRYNLGEEFVENKPEIATGFTLFVDTLLNLLPQSNAVKKIFIPIGSRTDLIKKLTEEGYIAIAELTPSKDRKKEALRLGCTHILLGQKTHKLS